MPRVSVIVPTYNLGHMLRDTIVSVLQQTEHDLEVIVVDDGSTDNTGEVVKSMGDSRVRYFYKDNGGISNARNYGLLKATGEYVAFLDHDDLWPPNYLEVTVRNLEQHKEFGLVYSPISVVRRDGSKVHSYKRPEGKSGRITPDVFKKGFIWPSAGVIRRSILKDFYFDESLKRGGEDGDFFLRLSARCPFLFVPDVQAIRREHDRNYSWELGVLPARILVLERFYFRLGGEKLIPRGIARRKLSHACRAVAEGKRRQKARAAALKLYGRAISYWPYDLRLYLGAGRALLLRKDADTEPDWRMPDPLPAI